MIKQFIIWYVEDSWITYVLKATDFHLSCYTHRNLYELRSMIIQLTLLHYLVEDSWISILFIWLILFVLVIFPSQQFKLIVQSVKFIIWISPSIKTTSYLKRKEKENVHQNYQRRVVKDKHEFIEAAPEFWHRSTRACSRNKNTSNNTTYINSKKTQQQNSRKNLGQLSLAISVRSRSKALIWTGCM